MGRRTALMVAAVALAALGTTMVFLYVNGVNDRALSKQQPVEVLVATAAIAAGTSAEDAQSAGALDLRQVARSSAAEGALSDIEPIADQVALAPIFPGEQILLAKFGAPGSVSELPIPNGKMAVSVQLGDPARVAGFVSPGSRVAVFVTIADGGGGQGREVTKLLLPRAEVIATGASTVVSGESADTEAEPVPEALLTLAVDRREAEKVVYASQHGQLYFALLTKDSDVSGDDSGAHAENLFD